MVECMTEVCNQLLADDKKLALNPEEKVREILEKHDPDNRRCLTQEEFLVWTVDNKLPVEFAKLVFQLCHIVLGLRPLTRSDEGQIVRGWLEREEKAALRVETIWHLISMDWWSHWHTYVNFQESPYSTTSRNSGGSDLVSKKGGKKAPSLDSTLAIDSYGGVVTTGYHPISENGHLPNSGMNSLTRKSPSAHSNESSRSSSLVLTPSASPFASRKGSGSSTNVNSPSHGSSPPSRPGLIDNSHLVQTNSSRVTSLTAEGGKLKTSGKAPVRGKDFELIPERLWRALVAWYGGTLALPRQVIRNKQGAIELELNPLSIKIMKHQTISRPASNMSSMVGGYSAAAASITGLPSSSVNTPYGSSMPTTTRRYHAYQAAFSRRTTIHQIADFLCSRLHIKQEDLRLWYFRDENEMHLLENDNLALEDAGFKDEGSILVEVRSRDGTWPEEITSLCNNADRRSSTTSFLNSNVAVPGITGLNNLGNTCYMNTALQCVSNTKILAKYFNSNCHLRELNRTNPLGMKGHIAKRFGDLVKDMWSEENKAIAPIKLRWTIGRYRQHFAGFQQQDAQELLAFLLDGLHEDLNRVAEKPYVELKDSEGRPDLVVASEAWENHVLRNKSIVVDLFHGQLKSKVTCKVCSHESVRFDPFTFLSLPLPMESSIHLEVIVIRQDGSVPVKYGLNMDMESRYSNIRPRLSKLCKIPFHNLILVDIVQCQFRVRFEEIPTKMDCLNDL